MMMVSSICEDLLVSPRHHRPGTNHVRRRWDCHPPLPDAFFPIRFFRTKGIGSPRRSPSSDAHGSNPGSSSSTTTNAPLLEYDAELVLECFADKINIESKFVLSLFEIGGSSIFHVIHPFFWTKFGVYVLVLLVALPVGCCVFALYTTNNMFFFLFNLPPLPPLPPPPPRHCCTLHPVEHLCALLRLIVVLPVTSPV